MDSSDNEEDGEGLSISIESPVAVPDASSSSTNSSVSTSTRCQVSEAVGTNAASITLAVEVAESPQATVAKPGKRKSSTVSSLSSSSGKGSGGSSSFPTPFKCCGDFCGFALSEEHAGKPGAAMKESISISSSFGTKYASKYLSGTKALLPASTAVQMLFSQDELATLGDENLSSLLQSIHIAARSTSSGIGISVKSSLKVSKVSSSGTNDDDLHVITYRSIALAKVNREHLTASLKAQGRVATDQSISIDAGTRTGTKKKAVRRSSLLDSTASQEFRENSRLRMYGDMGESVANYYRQVRVCSDCYAIYTLLDLARKLQNAAGSSAETNVELKLKRKQRTEKSQQVLRDEWEKHVTSELEDKEKLYLRKSKAKKTDSSPQKITSLPEEYQAGIDDLDLAKLPISPGTTSSSGQRQDSDTLPVLLSPKSLPFGRKEPSGDTNGALQPSFSGGSRHSISMPVLPTSSLVSQIGIKHDKSIKTSLFKVPDDSINKQLLRGSESFKGLDKYLRGENRQISEPVLLEGQLFKSSFGTNSTIGINTGNTAHKTRPKTPNGSVVSTVLLVDSDPNALEVLHQALSAIASLSLDIESIVGPQEALQVAKTFAYDLILCERDFDTKGNDATLSGVEFTKLLRQFELQKSISAPSHKAKASAGAVKRTTVICVTNRTSREDLELYRDAGMDGCVSKPIHQDSLQHTVQAALAKALVPSASADSGSAVNAVTNATEALAQAKLDQQERKRRRRRRLEASSSLPFPGIAHMDAREDYVAGTFQMDAETAIPYCVMGNPTLQPQHVSNTFFNLVVIHDLFDTWERLQILLNPIIARYHGAIQVLVWNYPGQAYTTWRPGTLLNNVYHVQCFHALLQHLGTQGLKLWRDAPYYLMGIGNGGNIATRFCANSPPLDVNTRALLLVNAFAFVDVQLAQFLHDCLKVFTCTPESRPDLPVYFHTRFLFSPAYLARVSTPLALNLYTAVMNPITLDGRRALCQGALAHAESIGTSTSGEIGIRLRLPVLHVCSSQNALVNAGTQAQKLLELCGLEAVDSIGKMLRQQRKRGSKNSQSSCIVWLPSGHEVFQECKPDMLLLIEQLVTGFHEVNDVAVVPPPRLGSQLQGLVPNKRVATDTHGFSRDKAHRDEDETRVQQSIPAGTSKVSKVSKISGGGIKEMSTGTSSSSFEDSFIDNVLSTVKQVVVTRPNSRGAATDINLNTSSSNQIQSPKKAKWTQFQLDKAQKSVTRASVDATTKSIKPNKQSTSPSKLIPMTSWDPTTPAFERLSSNIIYKIGEGSKIYPDTKVSTTGTKAATMPELKEYMEWRVKRNQKRLQRMERQARVIQRAFRAFYARTLIIRMKQARCAVALQRLWRAKLARKKYHGMKKEDWAVRLLQRNWRGKVGRDSFRDRVRKYLAAIDIQRIVRGYLAGLLVTRIRNRMHTAAGAIQRIVRQYLAKRRMFLQRLRRNSAVTIQRLYRGHVGRKRFAHEKDKFLYSKTQSQGITFGKQMLLEYKIYGTKLQSEVALLAKAKEDVEIQAEVLVNEICEFDEGIRLLETEMHALSQVETEAMARNMDEQGKWQLREQKMRLDREFTQMLAQIALRKEKLSVLEEKLQALDKERLAKEEELKSLERKLVILLEEQQQELAKIKHKQQTCNQLALDLMSPSNTSISGGIDTPGFAHINNPNYGSSPWSGQSPIGGGPRSTLNGSLQTPSAAGTNAASAFTQQQREEANSLMESTETMMKFGFMSMSMTYFSSMNMVRAMRKIGAHHLTLDSAAAVSNKQWPEYSTNNGSGSGISSPFGFQDGGGPGGSGSGFTPAIPPGSFPGQQPIQVAGWSVADVGRWLDTLALGQYKRAFLDAAVDGALLLHLNDDDLKNTLGMEHRLHRKKILTCVEQLREAECAKMKKLYGISGGHDALSGSGGGGLASPQRMAQQQNSPMAPSQASSVPSRVSGFPSADINITDTSINADTNSVSAVAGANLKVVVAFGEFCTLVRHGKLKQLKEALAGVSERRFDSLTVMQPFNPGVGTVYDDLLEKSVFHINKGDENGNSPLLLAAQNNNLKVAQLLLAKGANPNHQNVRALFGVFCECFVVGCALLGYVLTDLCGLCFV